MALTRKDLSQIIAGRPTSAILAATPGYTSQQFENLPLGTPVSPSFYDTLPARTQMPSVAAQYGLGAARQRLSPAMMLAKQQQRPAGFFDSLPSPMSPAGQALGAAATTGLQLSGWQDRPITLGQGLGAMAQAGMEAYTAAQAAERDRRLQELTLGLKIAESQKPDLTNAERLAFALGYKRGTPEFNNFIRDIAIKPQTVISSMVESEFSKQAVKSGFDRIKEADKQLSQIRDIEPRLDQIMKLLTPDATGKTKVDTGRLKSLTFPFRQMLVEAGLSSSEDLANIADEEVLRQSIAFIIPRMRVVGSGSTSDKEMQMFERAAPSFANSAEGNRKIAAGMYRMIQYQKERRNLMDKFMAENKSLIGFDAYADEIQGDLFPTYMSGDESDEARYEKDLRSGKIKKGDMIYNGSNFIFVQ